MTIIIIAVLVFTATLLGGFFALKFKDKLHLIVGFSAGAVLGIAFIDLLPEAAELVGSSELSLQIALAAVLGYMIIDRVFFNHSHSHHHEHEVGAHDHSQKNAVASEHKGRGIVRATSLVLHSFLDGLAIGFSFQVSIATGAVVAIAVLAHDFSDGINTVAAILKGGDNKRAKLWLVIDAIAPVVGIIVGSIFVVNAFSLGVIISIFAGFFVYIALADMIPESFHSHPKKWTTIMTVLGVAFIALVMHFAHF
jgi:ZIP family zinc transporter